MNGSLSDTRQYSASNLNPTSAEDIIAAVYQALKAKGYDPITQLVGYILSGDPTYITSHNHARSLICRLDRDEILEELVGHYLSSLDHKEG